MSRRKFIQKSALATGLVAMPAVDLLAKTPTKKITILHTNDQHSRIEPFEPSSDERYSNKGGFSRRAALIDKIRAEEKNVLLLDAGDIFQGTPYFNFYGGELEFKLMSKMGYDLATIGNHDFDNGLAGLKKQLPHAQFDFVSANYDFSNTILEGQFKPYKILKRDGVKIGVFGLGIELEGLVGKEYFEETKYLDPIEVAKDVTRELKAQKCDLIICLSHLGYDYGESSKVSDMKLAKATKDIDLIIGGHTHTFLKNPVEVQNAAGQTVIVNQVGWAGLYLGRVDFYLNPFTKQKEYSSLTLGVDDTINYV
ncbi:metallophosphatase [Weeksellaceae bacterium KMM 9713]|uniref:Metallophosphatase n=1 Tax=Profundicola chukchiensis TaxID=2961959 RepID=A0A9X4N2X2_9FLAO|nr:metallophosphatase [Profundicola chukchiensis]MDG4946014.1 metallophosphatase [Profundicola chukchiensis]